LAGDLTVITRPLQEFWLELGAKIDLHMFQSSVVMTTTSIIPYCGKPHNGFDILLLAYPVSWKLAIKWACVCVYVCVLQALSAADLSLVLYACRSVDPADVFSESPCQLSQPVLLSLIQQLSANFDSDVELKHRSVKHVALCSASS